jgi:cytidine deaminase
MASKRAASQKRRAADRATIHARSDIRTLIAMARRSRDYAFAPFSRFKVGAAVKTRDGRIYTGCNIENASFGLTICAERTALFKAISEGTREFLQVVIVTDATKLTPPCGACRQVLWEFAPDAEIILANIRGRTQRLRMSALLPMPFDSGDLE